MFPDGTKVRITRHEDDHNVGRVGYTTFRGIYASGEQASHFPVKPTLPVYIVTEQRQGRVGETDDFAGAVLCYETQIEPITDGA